MIKNLRKKGFTIVELVIVIAVIAILAAILIPTFSGIIKKANIASDTALAKNMNTALVMAESDGVEVEDVSDVLVIINEAGYIIENLNPTTQGYYFAWDSESNQILFLDDTLNIHYQSKQDVGPRVNWWTTVDSATEAEFIGNEGISLYFENDITENITLSKLISVDTGFYTHTGTLSMSDPTSVSTVLRGQFDIVEITADLATVVQYGIINTANIVAIAESSFDIFGIIGAVNLTKGHVHNVGGQITSLKVAADQKVTNEGLIEDFAADQEADTRFTFVNTGILSKNTNLVTAGSGSILDLTPDATLVYSISNATELQNFAKAVNNGADYRNYVIEITKSIDLRNRTWTPIGNKDINAFKGGTIEGNNHKILGLTNNGYVGGSSFISSGETSVDPFGLFGWVIGNITIKNLEVNVSISSVSKAGFGAFIGCTRGKLGENIDYVREYDIVFENCISSGTLKGIDKVGGFIGTAYVSSSAMMKSLTMTNCINNASILGSNDGSCRIGGFVGTLGGMKTTVTNCTNNGKVEYIASVGNYICAGGFFGLVGGGRTADNPLVLNNSSNNGSINGDNNSHTFQQLAVHNYIGLMNEESSAVGTVLNNVTINGMKSKVKVAGAGSWCLIE